jgi:hypothetical protein
LVIKDGHEGEGHFHAVQLRQRRIGLKKWARSRTRDSAYQNILFDASIFDI